MLLKPRAVLVLRKACILLAVIFSAFTCNADELTDKEAEAIKECGRIAENADYIPGYKYPNLSRVKEYVTLEKETDFEKTQSERGRAIDHLSETLSIKDLTHLASLSAKISEDKKDEVEVYNFIEKHVVYMDDYPNLKKYTKYLNIYISVNWHELANEIEDFKKNK